MCVHVREVGREAGGWEGDKAYVGRLCKGCEGRVWDYVGMLWGGHVVCEGRVTTMMAAWLVEVTGYHSYHRFESRVAFCMSWIEQIVWYQSRST